MSGEFIDRVCIIGGEGKYLLAKDDFCPKSSEVIKSPDPDSYEVQFSQVVFLQSSCTLGIAPQFHLHSLVFSLSSSLSLQTWATRIPPYSRCHR